MRQSYLKKGLKFETPATFRIRVQGELDESWSDRLGGMSITTTHTEDCLPVSTLVGRLLDQAALAGVLNTLYEMHLPLITMEAIDAE